MLADRVFVGKQKLRRGLRDDHHVRALQPFVGRENAPADQRNANRGEVSRIRPADHQVGNLVARYRRVFDHVEYPISAIAFSRGPADQSRRFNPRNGAHPLDQALEKSDLLDRLPITRFGKGQAQREHIVHRHPDVVAAQALIALQQKTGSHQQNHGEADLEHQQRSPKRCPCAAALLARRLLQRGQNPRMRGTKGGDRSGEQRTHGDGGREQRPRRDRPYAQCRYD